MKLIIDIPEVTANEIKDNAMFAKEIASSIKWDITSAIVNGTPLEDIKAEISKQEIEYRKQNDRCGVGLDMALRIINKHIAERSDKE